MHAAVTPVLEDTDVHVPDAYCPVNKAEWMSYRLKERPCLKQQGRQQKRMMADL